MKRWSRGIQLASLACTLAATPLVGQADDEAAEYRHSVFNVIGWNFGPMAAMVKGEVPYDAEEFSRRADRVAAMSQMALEGFPEGSDRPDDEAKPAIWREWSDFEKKMENFTAAASRLAQTSTSGDWGQVRKTFIGVADTCKACHDKYRED